MTRSVSRRPRKRNRSASTDRYGLTLIELLVSTAILATLMALILPGIMSARSSARRAECLNHLRQLAVAEINYEQAHRSVPPFDDGLVPGNWIFHLLPYLDQAALQRELAPFRQNGPSGGGSPGGPVAVSVPVEPTQLEDLPHLSILTCPVDEFHFQTEAGLSFVANAGYMRSGWGSGTDTSHSLEAYTSSNPNWSEQVTQDTGVFFRSSRHTRLMPQFADGRSQTILFSENLQAGRYDSRYTGDIGFAVEVDYADSPGPPLLGPDLLALGSMLLCFRESTINADVDQAAPGTAPRPSSHHHQGVNAAFVDGSARFLSESINDFVYFRLVSSSGTSYGQLLVSDTSY